MILKMSEKYEFLLSFWWLLEIHKSFLSDSRFLGIWIFRFLKIFIFFEGNFDLNRSRKQKMLSSMKGKALKQL